MISQLRKALIGDLYYTFHISVACEKALLNRLKDTYYVQ